MGGDGRVRIAGLGTASIPSTASAMDVDRSFHGAAPELIDPQRFRLTDSGATMASDVYAFGVLAWEVSCEFVKSLGYFSDEMGPGFCRTRSVPRRESHCRGFFDVEGAPAG